MKTDIFSPVLRFAVCSDLHIREENDVQVQRLRQLMQRAYRLAQESESYRALDAFLFAGDLTDGGTPAQYRAFWDAVQSELQNGTRVIACVARAHDNWEQGRVAVKTGLRHFREITGLSTDTHLRLGAFHFIAISTCEKKGRYYSRKQKRFLKRALAQATKENPRLPVFVMQHEHITGTVYGSSSFDGWGNGWFKKILSRYPQVVHFSGHSHYPLNDPRSVYQSDFTAVGTGALRYAEFTVDKQRTVHPPQHETISQGWIVEVDEGGRVKLDGYDFLSGTRLCSYLLDVQGDKKNFTLSPAQQKARSSAPRFPSGAKIETERHENALSLTFPAAESTDGFPVFLYRAFFKDKNGETLSSDFVLHEYWFAHEKPTYTCTLEIPKDAALLTVTAENAYGMTSAALKKEDF